MSLLLLFRASKKKINDAVGWFGWDDNKLGSFSKARKDDDDFLCLMTLVIPIIMEQR